MSFQDFRDNLFFVFYFPVAVYKEHIVKKTEK